MLGQKTRRNKVERTAFLLGKYSKILFIQTLCYKFETRVKRNQALLGSNLSGISPWVTEWFVLKGLSVSLTSPLQLLLNPVCLKNPASSMYSIKLCGRFSP